MRRILTGAVLAVLLAALCAGCGGRGAEEPLTATLLRVGRADAIVLNTEGHTMVIDAGEEEDGAEVAAFLRDRGIRRVDVLVITHFDKDHVGGADTLVEELTVERVLLPDYEGDSTEYLDFLDALAARDIVPERLARPTSFRLGKAEVLVEPPAAYDPGGGEVDNNFSLITTVVHGENRLVFAGDAEKRRIRQWLADSDPAPCDFLKLPHHGVYNRGLEELLDALSPRYAAICSSEKNPADSATLELLARQGVAALETKDGDITVISDARRLEIRQRRR